jgi:hypothetical protein
LATGITACSKLSVPKNDDKWTFSRNKTLVQYKSWACNLATKQEE